MNDLTTKFGSLIETFHFEDFSLEVIIVLGLGCTGLLLLLLKLSFLSMKKADARANAAFEREDND
ncbi:hypothetical protein [Terasakiella pusilla]|uniref:hypothetical protein n=1 Tax=Terasakiella pusilla TaxID=64973 RepID=UPI003AA86AAC